MTDNETQLKIKGKVLNVIVDGLSPLEISAIAKEVEKKMNDIERKTDITDISKLAMMAALEFAIELYVCKRRSEKAKP